LTKNRATGFRTIFSGKDEMSGKSRALYEKPVNYFAREKSFLLEKSAAVGR
jgi:hypothetical protein